MDRFGEPECFADEWETRSECKKCSRWGACRTAIFRRKDADSLSLGVRMKMGFIPSVDGAGIICHMCGSVLPGAWKGLIVIRNGRNGVRMCDACLEARDAAIIERAASLGISPERLLELKTMSYKKYLWTPEWEMTRLLALNRADFKCQYCGYKDKLQVHHFSYATRGCERDEDLIVLCNNCHELNHGLHRYNWDHRPFHVRMGIANVV